jgi:plasmid stabilization system protein ParE
MTRTVMLLTLAEDDLAAAKEWYRQCHPHIEADFFACVAQTLDRIAHHPFSFAWVHGQFRQAFIRRFPYRIVFRTVADLIVVVAVLHTSRHPHAWLARLGH